MTSKKKIPAIGNLEGIFKGLGDLVEKLGDLAEKGEQLKRSGQFDVTSGSGQRNVKGVYGVSIKMGLGDEETQVEPFGNIHRDEDTGETTVQEVSEPLIDIFEEKDHIMIVAELPGIGEEDVRLDLTEDILTLHAERGSKKYHKEILLPRAFKAEQMERSCRNGVLEVKLKG